MLAVPVSAAVRPARDPVDAVWIFTAGHSLSICCTQKLNSGKSRLEPDSCSDTDVVGQFSRLESDAAAEVVDVVVAAEGAFDEEQAAAVSATAASTTVVRAAPSRWR